LYAKAKEVQYQKRALTKIMEEPTYPGVRTMNHEELVATYLRVQAQAREVFASNFTQRMGDPYFCEALFEEMKKRKASGKLPRSVTDYHVARLPASASKSVKTYYILRLSKPALDCATITTSTMEQKKAMAERANAYVMATYVARADFDVAVALGLPLDESGLDITAIACISEYIDEMNRYVEAVKWEEVYRKRHPTISGSSKRENDSGMVSEPTRIYPAHSDKALHKAALELGSERCGPDWCTLWSCINSSPTATNFSSESSSDVRLSPLSRKAQWHMYLSAVRDIDSIHSVIRTARGRGKFSCKDIPIGSGSTCVCGGDLKKHLGIVREVLEHPSLDTKTKVKMMAMQECLIRRQTKTKKNASESALTEPTHTSTLSKLFDGICEILEGPSLDRYTSITLMATKESLTQRLQDRAMDYNKRHVILSKALEKPSLKPERRAKVLVVKKFNEEMLQMATKTPKNAPLPGTEDLTSVSALSVNSSRNPPSTRTRRPRCWTRKRL